MPAIGNIILSTESSEAEILIDGVAMPVRVRRSARARAYKLTIDGLRGELRLSLPARANLKRALGWAQGHEDWVRAQMAVTPAVTLLGDGATFPLEGREVRICWIAGATRTIRLEGDRLILGGAAESVGARVLRWLRTRAKAVLEAETLAMAQDHGLIVASVGTGDTRSRWGSCTSTGAIRYSWRLILAPAWVRRSTVAHELAHLLHMDHSPAFHAAHARIYGEDPRPARAWLKAHGAGLHRYQA
ncbi:M48 family metallopeptidase [Sphingobium yanoikuyae]|jgi:predicted metal-dependent hydrolase|uniref:Putative metal-dependent hydrolase n=1 Tax=Sphingobium yanoikuyae TaxID=13690 RepID=A0A084EMK6_SPHYA|nr:putative metal-dependent hydrolase [Sphingobium yanoikuyae]